MKYKIILEESEEGYAVSVPGLPGCHSQGGTEEEAIESIKQAIQEYFEVVDGLGREKKIREIEVPLNNYA